MRQMLEIVFPRIKMKEDNDIDLIVIPASI